MAEKKKKRFIRVHSEGGFTTPASYVLVDRETGVNYLYCSGGYGGGLTVLLNRDGSPIVTPVPREYED